MVLRLILNASAAITFAMSSPRKIQIGLAGLGNVGAGVVINLRKNAAVLTTRTGAEISVGKVCVRDLAKPRDVEVPADQLTTNLEDLLTDPATDIIVELIGGTTIAYDFVAAALRAGKPVVTGNKALLAERGIELVALAEKENVPLYFEAAVAGGIPIIKTVEEALVGNQIESIYGIINGTSNYILTRMNQAGLPYADALKEAMDLGYAEADPTLDINGWDAAHKAIILAWLSYGYWPDPEEIHVEGIENIAPEDIAFADTLGYAIKLVGVVKPGSGGRIECRVNPALLPKSHILASVNGVFNALAVRGDVVGETLYYGSGAGQDATSSSVIADIADAAANIAHGAGFEGFLPHGEHGTTVPLSETVSSYYVRLAVDDRPGVIAEITALLAAQDIGILSIIQPEPEQPEEGTATLVLTLHDTSYGTITSALEKIAALSCTKAEPVLHRIEHV